MSQLLQNFQILNLLGYGIQGKVFLAKQKSDDQLLALKIIRKKINQNECQQNQNLMEQQILRRVNNENIVEMKYSYEDQSFLVQAFQFCQGGDLFNLMVKNKFSEQQAAFYAIQILNSLEYLHSQNIVHGDLKPENVLITKDGLIKLADFGQSFIGKSCKKLRGTLYYQAPEVIQETNYNNTIDFWSLGVVIYVMVTRQFPFNDQQQSRIAKKILKMKPIFPDDVSQQLQDLILKLLEKDPNQRLGKNGVQEIIDHEWFQISIQNNENYKPIKIQIQNEIDVSYFDKDFTQTQLDDIINQYQDYFQQ